MRTEIVFTLTGKDRVGIVEEVTQVLLDVGGNVETSRMARLGGEFAIIMLLSLPSEQLSGLDAALAHLTGQGYKVTTSEAGMAPPEARRGGIPYQVVVRGADHEGIIHDIARELSDRGISIESMETRTTRAPLSGIPLFTMSSVVLVPATLNEADWLEALEDAGDRAGVDVEVSTADEA